ncbi:MAG: 30S ribosomal protein S8 [Alphaproteobacteria bacterium]|nr:30S ribosomal protein S8 [Alphaproteobacteria bacterium]
MSVNDPIADMLTRIRNGQQARIAAVNCPSSKQLLGVLAVLEQEGYIRGFEESEEAPGRKVVKIMLKYYEGEPVVKELKRVSKPGRRVYASIGTLPKIKNGLGISILSTSKGILSDYDARQQNVGGELLCSVF